MPSELQANAQAEGEVEPVDVTVPEAADTKDARAVALASKQPRAGLPRATGACSLG